MCENGNIEDAFLITYIERFDSPAGRAEGYRAVGPPDHECDNFSFIVPGMSPGSADMKTFNVRSGPTGRVTVTENRAYLNSGIVRDIMGWSTYSYMTIAPKDEITLTDGTTPIDVMDHLFSLDEKLPTTDVLSNLRMEFVNNSQYRQIRFIVSLEGSGNDDALFRILDDTDQRDKRTRFYIVGDTGRLVTYRQWTDGEGHNCIYKERQRPTGTIIRHDDVIYSKPKLSSKAIEAIKLTNKRVDIVRVANYLDSLHVDLLKYDIMSVIRDNFKSESINNV